LNNNRPTNAWKDSKNNRILIYNNTAVDLEKRGSVNN